MKFCIKRSLVFCLLPLFLTTPIHAQQVETADDFLADQMAMSGIRREDYSSIGRIQPIIAEDMAVLVFANVDQQKMIQLLFTKEQSYGMECSSQRFVKNIMTRYGQEIMTTLPEERKQDEFAAIIEYYRALLQDPTTVELVKEFGKDLYDLLLDDVQEHIREKTTLLIVPDGILNFLPFETLVDKQDQYLVESFQVRYTQSLKVLELLESRNYSEPRVPLLIIGSRQSEIKTIRNVVAEAEILADQEATEAEIKFLSDTGTLAGYKALHFATQATLDFKTPEQSALVLERGEHEDGYLRIDEISQLNLKADFVNLSGGETGLGKLYKGEGVVGFIQAFMLAGANGVSATLWPVVEESTAAFMSALYQSVEKHGLSYAEAMTEVKRRFINGDFGKEWQAPYYWAPFVYYGKN